MHGMVKLVGVMGSFGELVEEDMSKELLQEVKRLNVQIMEELTSQRELIYAEKGMLACHLGEVAFAEFMGHAVLSLSPLVASKNKRLLVKDNTSDTLLYSYAKLLPRVLLIIVNNAV